MATVVTGFAGTAPAGAEWAAAWRPHPNERTSGDRHVVHETDEALTFGVIDGLGHGAEAATAAEAACDAITQRSPSDPTVLLEACELGLARTRGAAVTVGVLAWDAMALAWAGVGNVEGVLVGIDGRPRESVVLRAGIVGARPSRAYVSTAKVRHGELIALASDGVLPAFRSNLSPRDPVGVLAERALASWSRADDDALILVLRAQQAE